MGPRNNLGSGDYTYHVEFIFGSMKERKNCERGFHQSDKFVWLASNFDVLPVEISQLGGLLEVFFTHFS